MERRAFLKAAMAAGAASLAPGARAQRPDEAWTKTWNSALATLASNIEHLPHYDQPVLFEGPAYRGIWQESGPTKALLTRSSRSL